VYICKKFDKHLKLKKTMKQFMDENFLLETETAQDLFHNHAAKMPIIDYHCHLIPEMVANDHKFKSITELWLGGDHYKWRAMRTNGIDEKYCTGQDTSDWEKFEKWAETVPYTFRNPLYHWTHLELRTAFGIKKLLSPATAREIFDECNEKLKLPEFSARGLMRHYGVECVCTTDDPIDDLHYHKQTRESGFEIRMIPAWRPDKAMAVDNTKNFSAYVNKLGEVAGVTITKFNDLIDALQKRHDFFAENGCKLSDHGIEEFYNEPYTDSQIETIFEKAMRCQELSSLEIRQFKNCMLTKFAEMDFDSNWTQQYHYGAIRDNNTKMFNQLGPDTGFDSIGEFNTAKDMSGFLNRLNMEGKLTRTILYTLNPCANEVIATMLGNFQDGSCPGKIQFGSGWWFNDQLDGMVRQMNALSALGLLSRFVGMLTDSRSFLSYPRHEYFRRTLCNLLGNDVENGLLPNDKENLYRMVEDISYNNAKNYFKF
jgi:glucuronate isomerase